jgi:hypothetical protein
LHDITESGGLIDDRGESLKYRSTEQGWDLRPIRVGINEENPQSAFRQRTCKANAE